MNLRYTMSLASTVSVMPLAVKCRNLDATHDLSLSLMIPTVSGGHTSNSTTCPSPLRRFTQKLLPLVSRWVSIRPLP